MDDLEKIWEFGRLLWNNEYGEDPGDYDSPNDTNMTEIFEEFIKSLKNV